MTDDQEAFCRLAYDQQENDCSVRALAVACVTPYDIAEAAMAFAGRPRGHSATAEQIARAAHSLGCRLHPIDVKAKTLRTLSRELAGEHGAFMAFTCRHVVGIWQGEIIDWARNTLSRIDIVCLVARYENE